MSRLMNDNIRRQISLAFPLSAFDLPLHFITSLLQPWDRPFNLFKALIYNLPRSKVGQAPLWPFIATMYWLRASLFIHQPRKALSALLSLQSFDYGSFHCSLLSYLPIAFLTQHTHSRPPQTLQTYFSALPTEPFMVFRKSDKLWAWNTHMGYDAFVRKLWHGMQTQLRICLLYNPARFHNELLYIILKQINAQRFSVNYYKYIISCC